MNYLYVTRETQGSLSRNRCRKWRDIDERGNYRKELKTYVHADYGNSKETSKSVTGFVIHFNRAAIDRQSKMQSLVAQSMSEAETYAACEAVKRTTYVRCLANELRIKQIYPTIVHENNDAVISFVENYDKVRQTKHFIV